MAVAIQTTSTLALGTRTNSTITAPSGITNGDLLLAIVCAGDGGDQTAPTVTGPAGFTKLAGTYKVSKADPYAIGLNFFTKIASGESGNYTFTHSSADSQGLMYRITGHDTTTPLTAGTWTEYDGVTPGFQGKLATALSVTPTVNDSLVIYAVQLWDGGPGAPPTGTTPTFTERLDAGVMYVADGVLATAGATGNKVNSTGFTAQGTGQRWGTALFVVNAASSGAQTITGALVTDADTFHAATVTRGAVTISGALYSDADTFYGATIGATYTITGALYSDPDTFYGATVTPGAVTISGALYSDADTFYGATVGRGAVTISGALYSDPDTFYGATVASTYTITGALYSDADTFYGATVTPGAVTITGALYTDADTFHAATVSQGSTPQTITGALYTDADTFYGATVAPGAVGITGALYSDPDTFYAATVSLAGAPQTITGALYTDADTFYGATVLSTYTISGALYVNPDTFYGATVAATYSILAARYDDPDTFYSAQLTWAQMIIAARYDDPDTFYSAVLVAPGLLSPTIPPSRVYGVSVEALRAKVAYGGPRGALVTQSSPREG